jgi:hypothetical protein
MKDKWLACLSVVRNRRSTKVKPLARIDISKTDMRLSMSGPIMGAPPGREEMLLCRP